MDDHNRNSLTSIERFIDILSSEEESESTVGKALFAVSEEFGIGRAIGELTIPVGKQQEFPVEERFVFFTSDEGFDKSSAFEMDYPAENNGTIRMTLYAMPGRSFTEERYGELRSILNILNMHFGKSYLIKKAEKGALTQLLTGLPNASGYLREVGKKYVMGSIEGFVAYYFNLKGFGLVNRRFGQREGNAILCRYVGAVKPFFKDDELFGHLGGDNFVALVHKGPRNEEFQKLLAGVEIFGIQDGIKFPLTIAATAGYMPVEMPCAIDRIIGGPSDALAYAKRTKQSLVEMTDNLSEEVNRAKAIEQNFQKALANNEFTVFYQPKVNSVTGKIIGTEALTRWFENGRLVPPMVFVPILERTGQIADLDLAMLELVCRDIAAWKERGNAAVPASVNFSRKDLGDPYLPEKILGIITKYGIERNEIIIEITETTSEEEQGQMAVFLNRLKEFNIQSSIDDFGTGYSSLSVLREFPVGEIKIDRSFINRELGQTDEIIIQSIIDMAEKLNIDVITEGVEQVEQKDFLHRLGCDRIQGFLYDQPLPKDKFEERMKEGCYKI